VIRKVSRFLTCRLLDWKPDEYDRQKLKDILEFRIMGIALIEKAKTEAKRAQIVAEMLRKGY
jgi:hypothetical protein